TNRRQFPDAVLTELREERFFVVQGKEGDEGLLRRRNGLLDPPQLMRLPRLDDGQDVIDRDVQRVMPPEVLRSLDDDAGDAYAVRERLELDALHPNREGDSDLLAPFRPDLVGLHFLAAVGRGANEVPGKDEVVEMPEVVRVLHADLDLPRLWVPMEDAHRVAAMERVRISAYRSGPTQ